MKHPREIIAQAEALDNQELNERVAEIITTKEQGKPYKKLVNKLKQAMVDILHPNEDKYET